jgi:anti-sigma regulatory factor (Ser/Thr protein kinase)
MKTVELPEHLDGPVQRTWAELLAESQEDRQLALDFARVKFACPMGLLTIGREIRRVVAARLKQGKVTMVSGIDRTKPVQSFLSHVGFFDYIGLPNAKPMGSARGSSTYVPIRKFTRAEVVAGGDSKRMRANVAAKAKELAEVVAGVSHDSPAYWPVAYSVREVIRNVFEHSGADECFVSAQKWSNDAVEMAVVDEGIGIRASLAAVIDSRTDADALEAAIKPGITRSSRGAPGDDEHGNTGFGLYVLSEFGRCFGRFTLASGSGCFSIGADGAAPGASAQFSGTAVGIRLDKLPHSFEGTLNDIVSEGEKSASAEGRKHGASKESRSKDIDGARSG